MVLTLSTSHGIACSAECGECAIDKLRVVKWLPRSAAVLEWARSRMASTQKNSRRPAQHMQESPLMSSFIILKSTLMP